MIVIGLLVAAAAVVAAAVLITQNTAHVDLHALGGVWSLPLYGVLIAGMVILVVAFAGLAVARAASGHALRLRRERRALAKENRRLQAQAATSPGPAAEPPSMRDTTP